MIDQKENSAHLISDQSCHNSIRRFLLVLPKTNIVATPPRLELNLVRFREILLPRSGSYLLQHKVVRDRQSIFNRSASKMPMQLSLFDVVVDVILCRTRFDKIAVIYQDYYFHHNRKYKVEFSTICL
jgi:hypothetical protein